MMVADFYFSDGEVWSLTIDNIVSNLSLNENTLKIESSHFKSNDLSKYFRSFGYYAKGGRNKFSKFFIILNKGEILYDECTLTGIEHNQDIQRVQSWTGKSTLVTEGAPTIELDISFQNIYN